MVMFVLDDCSKLDTVLEAWEAIGVSGVTIIESTGIHRRWGQRPRISLRFGIEQLTTSCQEGHYTLFVVVQDEAAAHKCIATVEGIVGDLSTANTGILAAWPLMVVKGVPKKTPPQESG
jgi:nitrogen regulatory protein PII